MEKMEEKPQPLTDEEIQWIRERKKEYDECEGKDLVAETREFYKRIHDFAFHKGIHSFTKPIISENVSSKVVSD